jgi:hypothetical protein
MIRSACRLIVLAVILGLAAGCGKSGPKKIQLSGKVTFKGQPVPSGYISFLPEVNQGNLGKEICVVQIKDGVYDSSTEQNPGVYPGPTTIKIGGFDGKNNPPLYPKGKQIFNEYELHDTVVEGPRDFEVPASAGQNLKVFPTGDP